MKTHYEILTETIQFPTGLQSSLPDYLQALDGLMDKAFACGAHKLNVSWSEKEGIILRAERTKRHEP